MGTLNILCTGASGYCGTWMARTKPDNVNLAMLNHETYHEAWEHLNWDMIVHLAPISPSRVLK